MTKNLKTIKIKENYGLEVSFSELLYGVNNVYLLVISFYSPSKYLLNPLKMEMTEWSEWCRHILTIDNVVMIYEEKRQNDWRFDIKALLTDAGNIAIKSTTKKYIEMTDIWRAEFIKIVLNFYTFYYICDKKACFSPTAFCFYVYSSLT
jgi:hypothetical protein